MKNHDHEYGEADFCVHCHSVDPARVAYDKSASWLIRANELKEKGELKKAEKAYEKSAHWLMKFNELTGN